MQRENLLIVMKKKFNAAAASDDFDDEIPFINSIKFIGSLFYTNSS